MLAGNIGDKNLTLAAALEYAGIGWHVIPLHNITAAGECSCGRPKCRWAGKHPRVADWIDKASTDPATIERWLRKWPDCNIGIACGPSGMIVLDVDPRNSGDKTLAALEAEHGPLTTPFEAATGGSGRHLVFSAPKDGQEPSKPGPGLDIKGSGGLIVVWPSRHLSGKRYAWANDIFSEMELWGRPPDLPEWFPREAAHKDASAGDFQAPPSILLVKAALHSVSPDEHDVWLKIGMALKDAYGQSGYLLWRAWSIGEAGYSERPEKWNEAEERKRWDSFRSTRGKRVTIGTVLQLAKEGGWNGKASAADEFASTSKVKIFTTRELETMQFKPEKYIADKLIAEGCSLLGARPKAGKSWLALDLARAVSVGDEILGHKCEQGAVLYLALEDGQRRLQKRYRKLAKEAGDWQGELHFANEWPRGKAAIDEMRRWVKETRGARLIIVDTYQRIKEPPKGKNGANYADDYDAGAMLQAFALETGVSVLLIHHTKKADADDPFDTLSGTLGNNAAADSLMVIRNSSKSGHMVLHARGRDLADYSLPVEFEGATCRWTKREGDDFFAQTETERKIIEALKNAEEPLTPAEIAEIAGVDANLIKVTLTRKIGSGVWRRPQRGKYELVPQHDFEPLE